MACLLLPPVLVADIAGGGLFRRVMNVLLALQQRQCTGVGTYLDIGMSDNLFPAHLLGPGKLDLRPGTGLGQAGSS